MWQRLKELKWSFIVAALIYVALGVVLLVWPGATTAALCTLLGVFLLGYGAFQVIGFFLRTEDVSWGWGVMDLVVGIAALGFGIFALMRPDVVLAILPTVLGCAVIVDSCILLKRSFQLRSLGMERWWIALLLASVNILFGVVVIFNPFASMELLVRIIGGVLIYEGISDLITVHCVSARARDHLVEGTVVEERDD